MRKQAEKIETHRWSNERKVLDEDATDSYFKVVLLKSVNLR